MASKKVVSKTKSRLLASLVTGKRQPCAFCKREVDDEAIYGKLYAIGDLQVHYFCALLSCCLVQKGKDTEGLFGFLYHDIVAEVERSKKHKCSYCNTGGASLGCSVSQCRKQFHLPCGREKNAVSLFYGNYKSFCQQHAPKQKIPDHIMAQARLRMKKAKNAKKPQNIVNNLKESSTDNACSKNIDSMNTEAECVCVICYESVCGYPSVGTFWPPCCARDAWFHSSCVQRMALSAGMHYLKCPLCNDKEQFYEAVVSQGYYVPDRDAAWELEQNAFAEIYERPYTCSAETCLCPQGRSHDADTGEWDIQLCLLCGTLGSHAGCSRVARYVCAVCTACAPRDMDTLATRIDALIQSEQKQNRLNTRRPLMPSRMSLRRTKARIACDGPSTSQNSIQTCSGTDTCMKSTGHQDLKSDTTSARLELNLKPPRRLQTRENHSSVLQTIQNTMFSPTKLVEEGLAKKMGSGMKDVNSDRVISKIKDKLKKPRPLSVKKRIVDTALDQLVQDMVKETHKLREWCSPKKNCDIPKDIPTENINTVRKEGTLKTTLIELLSPGKLKDNEDLSPTDVSREDENVFADTEIHDDESSNSTFQLPSEFIGERNSDDSLSLFETPKKLTTVDIQKDSSLEISENNEVVNIDVVKINDNCETSDFNKKIKLKVPLKTEKCAYKFDPEDKETLVENKLDIDVECFKNFYLNEVDRDFKCNFNHKHANENRNTEHTSKLRTALDFAIDATKANSRQEKNKNLKRKIDAKGGVVKKKPKKDNAIVLHYKKKNKTNNIKVVCSNNNESSTNIDLTVGSPRSKKRLRKSKKNKKQKQNIKVKIKFREEQVRLKITESQFKKKKNKIGKGNNMLAVSTPKKLKQCILQYGDNITPNEMIVKPDRDVTPKKRNYVKLEKSPDSFIQTSIQSFFKKVPSNV